MKRCAGRKRGEEVRNDFIAAGNATRVVGNENRRQPTINTNGFVYGALGACVSRLRDDVNVDDENCLM